MTNEDMEEKDLFDILLSRSDFLRDIPKTYIAGNCLTYSIPYRDDYLKADAPLEHFFGDFDSDKEEVGICGGIFNMKQSLITSVVKRIESLSSIDGLSGPLIPRQFGVENVFSKGYDWVLLNSAGIRVIEFHKLGIEGIRPFPTTVILGRKMICGRFGTAQDGRGMSMVLPEIKPTVMINRDLVDASGEKVEGVSRVGMYASFAFWDIDDFSIVEF